MKNIKKAKWEGLKATPLLIQEGKIFPSCFFIPENLPFLLFYPPFCFLFFGGFPLLLFYFPVLLFRGSPFAFLWFPICVLIIVELSDNQAINSCLIFRKILKLFKKRNGLPAFRWGDYPSPGGYSRPMRSDEAKKKKEVRRGRAGTACECPRKNRPCTPKHGRGVRQMIN